MQRKRTSTKGWRRPSEIGGEAPHGGQPAEDMYAPPKGPCFVIGCINVARDNSVYCGSHYMQLRRGKPLRPIFRKSNGKPTYQELLTVLTS